MYGEVISLHIPEVRVGHVPCELGSLALVPNQAIALVIFRGKSATCHMCTVEMAGSIWAFFVEKKKKKKAFSTRFQFLLPRNA